MTVRTTPTPSRPATAPPERWLRRWLALDAVATLGNAVAYLLAAGPVGRLLGLDTSLLVGVGAFLLLYGAAVAWLGWRPRPAPLAVRCVVELNVAWVVASLAAPLLWLDPTAAGAVWIAVQAVAVAGFAALQYGALRSVLRARPTLRAHPA